MAKRSTQQKKLRKLRKLLRPPVDRYIDPVEWLKDRRHARTSGEARALIFAGRLRSESHKVGFIEVPGPFGTMPQVVMVPAEMRNSLYVTQA